MRNTKKNTKKNRKRRKRSWLFLTAFLMLAGVLVLPSKVEAASRIWNKVDGVCYNGKGVKIPRAITRGIDVSFWQGDINWTRVANAGVDFAFIRVGYNSSNGTMYKDTQFENNMRGATQAGIPVGVYFYSVAKTTEQARKEAEFVISKIQGYKISYPVVFDLEDQRLLNGLTNLQRANIAVAFCNAVKAAGYYPMLYCNTNWYLNHVDRSRIAGIDRWMAAYGDSKTSLGINAEHGIWQATDGASGNGLRSTAGLIAGIPTSNNVDINFGYIDYTKKITPRTYRANGDETTPTPTPVKRQGWYTTKYGNMYYYVSGTPVTGWHNISGCRYYFSSVGRMQIGKKRIGSYYYYFLQKKTSSYPKGAMVKGWYRTVSGNRYYFDPETGRMARSKTMTIGGKRYRFSANGVCQTR